MLKEISSLVSAGFAVHWLRPRSKAPFDGAWPSKPVASIADLKASYVAGHNVGVRLGDPSRIDGYFLHVIDMDIRVETAGDDARAALRELLPDSGYRTYIISTKQITSGDESNWRNGFFGRVMRPTYPVLSESTIWADSALRVCRHRLVREPDQHWNCCSCRPPGFRSHTR